VPKKAPSKAAAKILAAARRVIIRSLPLVLLGAS
jgi:hypothetical protein